MELSRPGADLLGNAEAALLAALARLAGSATGRHLERLSGLTSHAGAQRALARLVAIGIVRAEVGTAAIAYSLNRHHVLWSPVSEILGATVLVEDRIAQTVAGSAGAKASVLLFGSMARGEATAESDVDVLLVFDDGTAEDIRAATVDALYDAVEAFTGNDLQIVEITRADLSRLVAANDPLVDSWRADGRQLCGPPLSALLSQAA